MRGRAGWGQERDADRAQCGSRRRRGAAAQRERSLAPGLLWTLYEYLKGMCQRDVARLSSVVPSDRTKGTEHKLMQKFHLNTRRNFFAVQVTERWNRLSREVVESPPREILKNCLDTSLCYVLLDDFA